MLGKQEVVEKVMCLCVCMCGLGWLDRTATLTQRLQVARLRPAQASHQSGE